MRTNLLVPFEEKARARVNGARWDPALKVWYVPDGIDLTPFLQWVPGVETSKEIRKVLKTSPDSRSRRSVR